MVHTRRLKQALPPRKFTLYGEQGASAVTAVQIGDGAEKMRQIRKEMGHAAALIIDQQKADFLRRKLQGERENQALQQFRLSGARGPRKQGVRSVRALV